MLQKAGDTVGSITDKHMTPAFSERRTFSTTRRFLPEEIESLLANTSHVHFSSPASNLHPLPTPLYPHTKAIDPVPKENHALRILLNAVGNYFMLCYLQKFNQCFANFNLSMNHLGISTEEILLH